MHVLLDANRARDQVVNVASGVETRVVDLAQTILAIRRRPAGHVVIEPRRDWDQVIRRQADVSRLRRLFGEVPATPLEEGLRRTYAWLAENGHLREGVA